MCKEKGTTVKRQQTMSETGIESNIANVLFSMR